MESVRPSTEQLLKATLVTVPRPAPLRPVPVWSVPLRVEVLQLIASPDVVSVRVVVPAAPLMLPPGETDQVTAVAADADAALTPRARAAADRVNRAAVKGLRMCPILLIDGVHRVNVVHRAGSSRAGGRCYAGRVKSGPGRMPTRRYVT